MSYRYGYIWFFLLLFLTACREGDGSLLPKATGAPYSMLVVADSSVWKGPGGEALSDLLKADMPGLPQPESYFDITYTTPARFGSFFKPLRNIIMLTVDSRIPEARYSLDKNVWADSQAVMHIKAKDNEQMKAFVEKNRGQILTLFLNTELNRSSKQLLVKHNQTVSDTLLALFGIDAHLPLDMSHTKKGQNFFWASNAKERGHADFVVYSTPYTSVSQLELSHIIATRDSVLRANIPGGPEASYMKTQPYLMPVERQLNLNGKYCKEVRGLWEMEGDIMGGPFVSHTQIDEVNHRVITTEIFVYAPSKPKRNLLRRLEAALYTVKLPGITALPEVSVRASGDSVKTKQ